MWLPFKIRAAASDHTHPGFCHQMKITELESFFIHWIENSSLVAQGNPHRLGVVSCVQKNIWICPFFHTSLFTRCLCVWFLVLLKRIKCFLQCHSITFDDVELETLHLKWNRETLVFLHSFRCPNNCCLCPLLSVLWSSRPVWVHAEIFKHRFHSPLHPGVHPQDYCLRSTGEQLKHCALQHAIICNVICFLRTCCSDTWPLCESVLRNINI